MDLIPSLPKYMAISLLVSLALYFTGHLLLSFFRQEGPKSRQVFLKYSIGLIIWVISFAALYSSFKTIMVGAWIILLYSVVYYQKHEEFSLKLFKENIGKVEWKYIAVFSFLLLFITAYYVNRFGIQLKDINVDPVFYAGASDYIKKAKIESLSFNVINLSEAPVFYHFFDIWFMLLLHTVFNSSSLNNLAYVILPLYTSIITVGAMALAESYYPGGKLLIYLTIGLFFLFTSTFEDIFNPIYRLLNVEKTENEAFIYMAYHKLAIIYICVVWFFINAKTKDFFKILLPLSLVTIFYQTTLPGIVGGFGLFYLFWIIKTKDFSKAGWIILLWLIPVIYTALFFFLNRSPDPRLFDYSLTDTIRDNYDSLRSIFLSLSRFIRYSTRLILSLAVYLTLFILFYRNYLPLIRKTTHFYIIISLYVIALLTVCTVSYLVNSFQFITNLFKPIINTCCFILIVMLVFDSNNLKRYIGILLMILNFVFHFPTWGVTEPRLDKNNYQQLVSEFKGQEYKIAYILDSGSYGSIFDKSANLLIPFPNIRRFSDTYFPVCLSVFDIPEPKNINEKYTIYSNLNESPFYAYVVRNNLENDISQAQFDFLRLHRFDYLIVRKGSSFYKNLSSYNITKTIYLENEEYDIFKLKWN